MPSSTDAERAAVTRAIARSGLRGIEIARGLGINADQARTLATTGTTRLELALALAELLEEDPADLGIPAPMTVPGAYVRAVQAADEAGIQPTTLRKAIKDGRIPGAITWAGLLHVPSGCRPTSPPVFRPPAGYMTLRQMTEIPGALRYHTLASYARTGRLKGAYLCRPHGWIVPVNTPSPRQHNRRPFEPPPHTPPGYQSVWAATVRTGATHQRIRNLILAGEVKTVLHPNGRMLVPTDWTPPPTQLRPTQPSPPPPAPEGYLTLADLSTRLNLNDTSKVRNALKTSKFSQVAIKERHRWIIPESEVDNMAAAIAHDGRTVPSSNQAKGQRTKVHTELAHRLYCENHGTLIMHHIYSTLHEVRRQHRREHPECFPPSKHRETGHRKPKQQQSGHPKTPIEE